MGAEAPKPIAALAFCYAAKRYGSLSVITDCGYYTDTLYKVQ
jgi:hypothetical protein